MEQKMGSSVKSPLTFSDDLVKGKAYFQPLCKVEIEVELAPPLVKQEREETIKKVAKAVSVDGFRKGKAPPKVVEKNFSQRIEEEWKKNIVHLALREALKMTQIPLLNNEPKINYHIKNFSIEKGSIVSLFFETEPSVPSVNPEEVTLKKVEPPRFEEKELENAIRQIQFFFANWEKVTDRPIQENDFVILNVDLIEEDGSSKNLFTNVRFEVTKESMATWMRELVLGKKKGETVEGVSTPDEDASEKEKQELKPKKVCIHIKEIETTILPPFNDEFARKLGVTSTEQAKENIRSIFQSKIDAYVQEEYRKEIYEILLNTYRFDVPNSLVDRELGFRMQQLLQDPQYADHWNNMTEEAKKQALLAIKEQAEKAVRMFYLCKKILGDAKITISPKDLKTRDDSPLNLILNPGKHTSLEEKSKLHELEVFSRTLLERAVDYVIEHAQKKAALA